MPASQQSENRGATITITVLAVAFVILRFVARYVRGTPYGIDDYMLVLALIFTFAVLGINLAMVAHGLGVHKSELPPQHLETVSKLLISMECVYCTTVGIIKLSILAMYRRIFIDRVTRVATLILAAVTISWVISINFVSIFQCTPVAKTWNPTLPGHCINLKGSFIGNAVPNIMTDIANLSLPARQVWKLHASLTHRLAVIGIFLLGSFVVFASIYRFVTLFKFQPSDMTWTLSETNAWCVIEVGSGIISACLPTLRPLLQLVSDRFNTSQGTQSQSHGQTGESGFDSRQQRSGRRYWPGESTTHLAFKSGDELPLNSILATRAFSVHSAHPQNE
ncbi:hypothetical protein P170DRAFT_413233 [Aspergillus steynii IBT 23096]|uniref:Rhodopsin domain-containing protein n=1 Tax=Aspergillus steynii IBT 23096 TaxID=1392250 RepID=A0A2I2G398_9EURO|nr:uncharacterized protein P170DRAFT_413233 [Aspergillus steynii IBT 23096]PLB47349.1 hypothetical protein P170DRAFT_413233 [Aspergillus steynii IBT 23096]